MLKKKIEKKSVPSGVDICKKQLFNMLDRMEKVQIDEAQISPFMEKVNEKLELLDKEEIIKRFVSLEFNRFLKYYKNAPDLNSTEERNPRRSQSDSRDRPKGNRERQNRPERKGAFSKLYINIGRKDSLNPGNLIGLINDYARDRDINIGSIDIQDNYTVFQVGNKFAEKVIRSLREANYKGRKIKVDYSGEQPVGKRKSKSKFRKK